MQNVTSRTMLFFVSHNAHCLMVHRFVSDARRTEKNCVKSKLDHYSSSKFGPHCLFWRNILAQEYNIFHSSVHPFISIRSAISISSSLHLSTHLRLPRHLQRVLKDTYPLWSSLSPSPSPSLSPCVSHQTKIIQKGETQRTIRCVLPIDREIA